MKKYISAVILIITLSAILTSCSKTEQAPVIEAVEEYNVIYSDEIINVKPSQGTSDHDVTHTVESSNYARYDNADDLWDTADYVVLASPDMPYSEAEQYLLDSFNRPTDFDNISLTYSYCVRPFKINKVFKGENLKLKEIMVSEHIAVNGDEMKVEVGSYPTQQGDKYLLFLYRSNDEKETYFPILYQGKYNSDSEKNNDIKHIDKEMYKQVKEKFKEEFK